jgi:hypothetical protein
MQSYAMIGFVFPKVLFGGQFQCLPVEKSQRFSDEWISTCGVTGRGFGA